MDNRNKKVILTGGGSGGHIFPLIAVAEELRKDPLLDIFYIGPRHFLNGEFSSRGIKIKIIANAKWRRYFSLANIFAPLKLLAAFGQAFFLILAIRPAAVFSKGGPGALPVVFIAKIFGRPILIHESDSVPGLTNRWSGRSADRIAISFRSAAAYFPAEKAALTGNPIRADFFGNYEDQAQAKKFLGFDPAKKLILILGGSLGSRRLNDFFLGELVFFIKDWQIFHQTGSQIEEKKPDQTFGHYRSEKFLDLPLMKRALAAADLVISRSGSSAIFEIAAAGRPSILVPLAESAGDHQRQNAYDYAQTCAAIVVEEGNLKKNIVSVQIQKVLEDRKQWQVMAAAAKNFARPQAAKVIADEILKMAR